MAISDHLRTKDWTFSGTSRVAQRRNEFALFVLIASLAMFFFAALLAYVLLRLRGDEAPPDLELPWILWVSTGCAVAGSTFLWRALRSVRRERQDLFRPQLVAAFVLGTVFCVTQSIGLSVVLKNHLAVVSERTPAVSETDRLRQERPTIIVPTLAGLPQGLPEQISEEASGFPVRNRPVATLRLEGLLFVLILLHALHFVAGMIALTVVTRRGLAGRYDHEYHGGVRMCALYWRFLDVVWIALFGTFLITA